MDKYELVLDIVGHPEKFTSEQLAEIMSDPETRQIYNLLCKADSAIKASKDIKVDAEWRDFLEKHSIRNRRTIFWFGSRAASIAAIVCTSIVAVAAGLAVTVTVINNKPEQVADIVAVAPYAVTATADAAESDSVQVNRTPIMFEDESLDNIIKEVADAYGLEIRFNNTDVASLHLYYKFNPALQLTEIVEQLNTFEQINIKRNGNTLIID